MKLVLFTMLTADRIQQQLITANRLLLVSLAKGQAVLAKLQLKIYAMESLFVILNLTAHFPN